MQGKGIAGWGGRIADLRTWLIFLALCVPAAAIAWAQGAEPAQAQDVGLAQAQDAGSAQAQDVSLAQAQDVDPVPARVVVTTTMIGAAVADLAGDWCRVDVLIPPAGCPGHFDIGPQALAALHGAALILRHDYQQYLEARLREGREDDDRFVSLSTTGSQTLPGPYLDLCAQVAQALAERFPGKAADLQESLAELRTRVTAAAAKSQVRSRNLLRGMPLLTAEFQADLVNWAGAEAVVTFGRGEDMSLLQVQSLLREAEKAGVRGVVGNLQWGDREVRSFSEELGTPGVTLSNYPAAADSGAWESLLHTNLGLLYSLTEDD